ncbi:MAG: hypothetical protein AAF085_10690, partial [Planctomycetota bacterium]
MKQNIFPVLVLLITAALLLPQAHAEDPKTRGKAGDLLTPLAMGNTWVYASEEENTVTTERIEGVVLFEGRPWHLLRSYERQADQPAEADESIGIELWLAQIDGHECDAFVEPIEPDDEFAELKLGPISKYFRYPATLGDSYKPNSDDTTIIMTITAINEKVKTKAGEFDCVVYTETSTEDEGYRNTNWVAPGVGIVKTQSIEEGE